VTHINNRQTEGRAAETEYF